MAYSYELNLKASGVLCVAFSPDGKRLASGHFCTVKVWDATSGQETLTLTGHTSSVNSVVFSADGKRLTSAGEDGVKFWDATNGHEVLTQTLAGDCYIVLSPDGKRLASGVHGGIEIWDARPWTPELRAEQLTVGTNQ